MTIRDEAAPTLVAIDSFIDESLLRALEPTIDALDRILDEGTITDDEHGDPDGFDGIDRTGDIEHLIATEWLLVGEEPDEFVRRFSERELSFLRRAHVQHRRSRTSLVLFDSGPDQLGGPRIVHLACLVALARRCTEAGTRLRWGTLQDDSRHEARTATDLRRLLDERTTARSPDEPPIDALVDDCLVVSPTELRASRQLVLTDEDDDVRAVLIDHRRGTRRTTLLPLPPPHDAVRLLRRPTRTAPRAVDRSSGDRRPISNLVFDIGGNKVLARTGDGSDIAVYPAPNSVNLPNQQVRLFTGASHLGPVSAAGRVGRAVVAATVTGDGEEVFVHRRGSAKGRPVPEGRFPLSEPLAITTTADALGQVRWCSSTLHIRILGKLLVFGEDGFHVTPDLPGWRWGVSPYEVVATPVEDGYLIRCGSVEKLHQPPEGSRVFGVCRLLRVGIAVLRIEPDGRIVGARPEGGPVHDICATEAAVIDATAHHDRNVLAYRTTAGHVVVRSMVTGDHLYLWQAT